MNWKLYAMPVIFVAVVSTVIGLAYRDVRELALEPCTITLTGAATLVLPPGHGLIFDGADGGEDTALVRFCSFDRVEDGSLRINQADW